MMVRDGIEIDDTVLAEFCSRHGIARLALFGSALGERFGKDSDLDLLVEFLPGAIPGLLRIAGMEIELERAFGREVELRTIGDLSPYFRDQVAREARELYAA